MRAFFCFFFLTWVLCAQEKPDFLQFKAEYDQLKQEVVNAKERKVDVNEKWLEKSEQEMFRLHSLHLQFLGLAPADRQAAMQINLGSVIMDLRFIKNRFEVERAVADWSMDDVAILVVGVGDVLTQLNQGGLQFRFQPQQVQQSMYTLGTLSGVLKDPEFSSRVCKGVVGCPETIDAAKNTVAGMTTELTVWEQRARTWQPPPVKPEPEPALPNPEIANPKRYPGNTKPK